MNDPNMFNYLNTIFKDSFQASVIYNKNKKNSD